MNARTTTPNKTPNDNVIFDMEEAEAPGYQSVPAPRYESCSATSIAKSNDYVYHMEEESKSIKGENCVYASEKTKEQHEEVSKHHDPYCKLYHFNNNSYSI